MDAVGREEKVISKRRSAVRGILIKADEELVLAGLLR
jgi:hypothetical protein